MLDEMESAYFAMRAREEHGRAAEATEGPVRQRHEELARAYEKRVDALRNQPSEETLDEQVP
jgi:hypothetical protein